MEQYDEELVLLKANFHVDFYNTHLILLFNTLGQYEFREQKQILPQNIEMIQYLTQGSIRRNFNKVFGAASEIFADMLYNFLSDGAPLMHINVKTFLKKFAIIWPKKKSNQEEGEDEGHKKQRNIQDFYLNQAEEKQRAKDLNRISFEFYDQDRDEYLSVLDLIRMQTSFDDLSAIGQEIGHLLDVYEGNNIRPKYVKDKFSINFNRFHTMIEQSCIIKELTYVLVESFFKPNEHYLNIFLPNPDLPRPIGYIELADKRKHFNYEGIFDKDLIKLNAD